MYLRFIRFYERNEIKKFKKKFINARETSCVLSSIKKIFIKLVVKKVM